MAKAIVTIPDYPSPDASPIGSAPGQSSTQNGLRTLDSPGGATYPTVDKRGARYSLYTEAF